MMGVVASRRFRETCSRPSTTMRLPLRYLVCIVLAVACAPAGEDDAPANAADPAGRSPTRASTSAPDTLCAAVSAIAVRALGIEPAGDTSTVFPSPRGGAPWRGCRLRGEGAEPRGSREPRPAERLAAAMRQEGWAEDVGHQADGPDGSATAMRRGAAMCHLQHWWAELPMDDDSFVAPDSLPPTIDYVIEILCMPDAPPPLDG